MNCAELRRTAPGDILVGELQFADRVLGTWNGDGRWRVLQDRAREQGGQSEGLEHRLSVADRSVPGVS